MTGRSVRRYVVVGLGGIGSIVLRHLVAFLHASGERTTVLAVDGDAFEERNRARMLFERPGPKAVVLAEELGRLYPGRVAVLPVPHYLGPRNAAALVGERTVVLAQPDNHATRLLCERACRRRRDSVLVVGGNDGIEEGRTGTYGNVLVYVRGGGRDLTNPPSRFHPEIRRPADRLPTAQGCAHAVSAGAGQLLFTNALVAASMLGAFYTWRSGQLDYEEVYLDLVLARMNPVTRRLPQAKRSSANGASSAGRSPSRSQAAISST
jgi:hypothetical protein